MSIQAGDRLPDATFKTMTEDGPSDISTAEIFPGKTVVLFAVPGAYTPTCHNEHVPGFLENLEKFKAKGVDTIACVSVNDVFVVGQWSKDNGGKGKILFLSDGNGDFTRAIGMDFDGSAAGLGTRSKRYAMLVEDGVVKTLNVEDVPGVAEVSSAENLVRAM